MTIDNLKKSHFNDDMIEGGVGVIEKPQEGAKEWQRQTPYQDYQWFLICLHKNDTFLKPTISDYPIKISIFTILSNDKKSYENF